MQAWGWLGPTQLTCSLEEPHRHSTEHKPMGTQLPHAEREGVIHPPHIYV